MNGTTLGGLGKLSLEQALTEKVEAFSARAAPQDARERQKVAQEFASFLFLEVLKAMRAALPQEGLLETESLSRDIYTSMMDAELARVMAKRDATGFTRTVEKALVQSSTEAAPKKEPPPLTEGVISSGFGLRTDPFDGKKKIHHGVDIALPAGTPVRAAGAGKVSFSGQLPGYGNLVEVEHGHGLVTRYAHNAANLVSAGDEIIAGQPVALVGSTGRATGPHLHFEVRQDGKAVDPKVIFGSVLKGTKLSSIV